jgi:hypothetical protein
MKLDKCVVCGSENIVKSGETTYVCGNCNVIVGVDLVNDKAIVLGK